MYHGGEDINLMSVSQLIDCQPAFRFIFDLIDVDSGDV